jgi:hypothetical protein
MIDASSPSDPPILPPPAAADGAPACASAARLCAAIRKLVWLSIYITIMRLLGYTIPRQAIRAATRPAPAPAPAAAASAEPPAPRRPHRHIDRQMCLDLLAGINAEFGAPNAAPAPSSAAPLGAGPVPHARPARALPPSCHRVHHAVRRARPASAIAHAPARAARREKPPVRPASTRVHFVTIP